jgi:hypothetical protein
VAAGHEEQREGEEEETGGTSHPAPSAVRGRG